MNINHENIDKWLFDLVEGNLNSSQKRELNNFLNSHPEYKADLDSWKNSRIEESAPAFRNTAALDAIAGKSLARKAAPFALLFLLGSSIAYYFSGDESVAAFQTAEKNNFIPSSGSIAGTTGNNKTTNNPIVASASQNQLSEESSAGVSLQTIAGSPVSLSPVTHNRAQVAPAVNLVNLITENTNNPVNKVNDQQILPVEEKEIPVLRMKGLFTQKPEVNFSLYARKIAEARKEISDSAIAENSGSAINSSSGNKKAERIQQPGRKKRFSDAVLGIYNSRDHILLHPGNLNTVQYAGFAGSSVSPAFNMNYRNQYSASEAASSTGTFAYHQYSRKLKSGWGIGAMIMDYGQGDYSIRSGQFYYSPKIKIKKNFTVEPGITATYSEHTAGIAAINKHSVMEPVRGITGQSIPSGFVSIDRKRSSFDFSLSTLVNTKYFYAAVAVDNILGTQLALYNESTSPVENRLVYKAVAGTDYKRIHESKWSMSPQISFLKQGVLTELWAGSLLSYDIFHFGLAGSVNKHILGMAGITAGPFRVGYQFDRGASFLDDNNYNSHEASLRIALTGLQRRPSAILDNY